MDLRIVSFLVEVSPMSATYSLYVGVDIAATTFAATWTTDLASVPRAVTFPQSPVGFAAF